jgi:hypothetical protein
MNPRELPLVLTLTGFAALALGGWVGGSVVGAAAGMKRNVVASRATETATA